MRRSLIIAGWLLCGWRLAAAPQPVIESGGWSKTPGLCTGYSPAVQNAAPAAPGEFCYRADFRLTKVSDADFSVYLGVIRDSDRSFVNSHAIGALG